MYIMRALSVSCVNMPNVVIATFSDKRCSKKQTKITSVATQVRADKACSATWLRPINPKMCIGTPATITDKLSTKNVIRHIRCCQLWLRRSRKMVSRCVSFKLIVFQYLVSRFSKLLEPPYNHFEYRPYVQR